MARAVSVQQRRQRRGRIAGAGQGLGAAVALALAAWAAGVAVAAFVPASGARAGPSLWSAAAGRDADGDAEGGEEEAPQELAASSRRAAALGLGGAALLADSPRPARAAGEPAVTADGAVDMMTVKKKRPVPVEPRVTAFCEMKIKIGNLNSVKAKRVVIGVYGDEAPVLVRNFMEACSGRYPGEAATQVNYYLSDVKKIQQDKVITWADFKDGNTFTRQRLTTVNGKAWVTSNNQEVPLAGADTKTDETNSLRHVKEGAVSMRRGGGTFDFNVAPVENAGWLDKDNVVIGQVLEGMDQIKAINKVQVAPNGKPQKKIRCVNSTLSILDENTGQFNALKRLEGVTDFFA